MKRYINRETGEIVFVISKRMSITPPAMPVVDIKTIKGEITLGLFLFNEKYAEYEINQKA